MSELALRTVSAVLLAALALATAALGQWPLSLLWAAAGAAVAAEWTTVTAIAPRRGLRTILPAFAAATGLALLISTLASAAVLSAGTIVVCALGLGLRDRLWAVAGLWCGAVLAIVPVLVRADPALGLPGLLWMFAVVWTTDVAAFFTGRRLGGPKLWPRVSPKKTWSGFVGGTFAGTLAGTATLVWFGGWAPSALLVLASAAASVVGQGGDLAESALKRHFGVKDSSRVIPGHGGFMDRLDGFWAVSVLVGAGVALRGVLR
ncbi:phosphatidate cytidylyltransferase [Chelatococcus reniformis]|uniref:Phosphatidate cytidylyltransferase n=1 Tax=Chelatococcus reniformis TaxID=1494448 RepID=A0A916UFU7_9HYPH|nr:phosphatidate cytidylyltransferase [Chelatococcus reniformis]GGC69433.1 phosphatidate cytidylyltransferase [Chelatococcus reniformis]